MIALSRHNRIFNELLESKVGSDVELLGKVSEELSNLNWPQQDIMSINLAMIEAVANAIEHGNKFSPSKKVSVNVSIKPEIVHISVADHGEGFNVANVPDPRQKERLLLTRGRGIFLINSFMDSVKYNEQGNEVTMTKKRTSMAKAKPIKVPS